MTTFQPNSRRHSIEGSDSAELRLSLRFQLLLEDLDSCIEAERRLQREVVPDVFAPVFDEDIKMAEGARDALMARIDAVIASPAPRGYDRPLHVMALFLHTLLSIESDADRAYVHQRVVAHTHLLFVKGGGPDARMVRTLQDHFFTSCAQLMAMQDLGGPGLDQDISRDPELAA